MNTKFRLLTLVALVPFLFLSQSCEKIKDEINKIAAFDVNIELPAEVVTIDSVDYKSSDGVLDWKILEQYKIEVDLKQILADNDIESADFTNGRWDSYEATLIYPDWVDFSHFTDKFKVTAATNQNFSDEIEVAYTQTISPGTKTVTFLVNDVDITSYIKAEVFYLRIWGFKTNVLPSEIVNIEFKGEVKVKVNPL
jgi:hypothetical protein